MLIDMGFKTVRAARSVSATHQHAIAGEFTNCSWGSFSFQSLNNLMITYLLPLSLPHPSAEQA